ncbi:hypothetical protein OG339_29340 [Streptosporangium sp. NBC_01495]|uniref:hypothetical protein n=1 Tax=Streptosporangium sp. NBC_01495 TaxID=2903899 RepID=UPI002E2EF2B2|nr:hypothetical protein [Streptosporangium sp. NBC_01495]
MILISAGLVLTAIVLLIAGFVLAKPFLVMWSIAVSVLSAVFLVIGALLRRHELFPGGDAGASQPLPPKGPMPAGPLPAPHGVPNQPSAPQQMMVRHGMPQAPAAPTQPRRGPVAGPATAAAARRGALDPGAIVLVIPGRKRYHVAGCRQLAGRDHEELTHEEALEEGFTPCTTCLPAGSTSGPQSRETPPGVRKPDESLTVSRESGPLAGAHEPGAHEATARFTSPYRPVQPAAPSGGQQAPGARPEPQRPDPQRSEAQRPESQRSEPQRPESRRPGAESPQARFETSQTRAESPASPASPVPPVSPAPPVARRDVAPARPETSAERRESTTSREEARRSPQEPVVPVARPYVKPPEPQARPQEPASPPARPAEQPTRPAIRLPKIPEIPHAASEATSWFNRDAAARTSGQESPEASTGSADTSARPDSAKAGPKTGRPAGSGSTASGSPGSSGTSATTASASRAEAPEPDEPDTPVVAPAKSGSTGPGQAEAEAEPTRLANPKPAKAEPVKQARGGSAKAEPAEGKAGAVSGAKASPEGAETATAGRDASPEPSGSAGRATPAKGGAPEPVEPAETASGRAGRQVAADSTSAKPAPAPEAASTGATSEAAEAGGSAPSRDDRDADDRGDDTSPGGIPAIKDRPRPAAQERGADGETVTVIVGTRRFHDSDCPLVKGASVGGSGIETMSRAEAEQAGLSNCPICRLDRRT